MACMMLIVATPMFRILSIVSIAQLVSPLFSNDLAPRAMAFSLIVRCWRIRTNYLIGIGALPGAHAVHGIKKVSK